MLNPGKEFRLKSLGSHIFILSDELHLRKVSYFLSKV